jgi:uncharacterized protein (DUF1501 family)
MDRREFLKAASAAGCLASGVGPLAWAGDGQHQPLLLALFLRGGADGLHLLGPSADPDYRAARPPELRVQEDGERPGLMLDRTLDATLGFCLHPDALPLAELYKGERLALIHAVGLLDGSRSHFVAQDMMERGVADGKRIAGIGTGWLTRALAGLGGVVPAYSATSSPAFALHGLPSALSVPDLSSGLGLPWGTPTNELLRTLSAAGNSAAHRASLAALEVLQTVERHLPRDASGRVAPYKPEGRANYEGAGDLARSLPSVARLARMDVGLAAAWVDHGGWDTHEGQPGRFAQQVKQLSLGLAAFHEDMAAANRKCTVLVMTEFGRRLRANKSQGTDHGHGACWLVMGDGVRGGRMFGRWPGLATPRLDQGVDLAVTTDYRQVLAETLRVCALPERGVLPDWQMGPSLGLFADG